MKLDTGAVLNAAAFLQHFDNRAGYWTMDQLHAAVVDVLGTDRVLWTAPQPSLERLQRLVADVQPGQVVVVLLPARTGSDWFQQLVAPNMDQVVFLRGRVRLPGHDTTPAYDSMLWLVHVGGKAAEPWQLPKYEAPATSYVMEHGTRDVVLCVEHGGRVSFYDDRLAQLVESGADYAVTLKPKPGQ